MEKLCFTRYNLCMQKNVTLPLISITLNIRAGRIPVSWTVREIEVPEVREACTDPNCEHHEHPTGFCDKGRLLVRGATERTFWPRVKSHSQVENLSDPLTLRAELFRTFNGVWADKNRDPELVEQSVLMFLDRIGAWRIVPAERSMWVDRAEAKMGMRTSATFLHRSVVDAYVVPFTLDELLDEIEYWYRVIKASTNSAKLKKAFASPPDNGLISDQFWFAQGAIIANTLPVSLEWEGRYSHGVVEPITGSELFAALAWADALNRGTLPQVCAHCKTRFNYHRKRTHCTCACAHAAAVSAYKRRKRADKATKIP